MFQSCLVDRVLLSERALAHAFAAHERMVGWTRYWVDYEHVTRHWVRVDDRLIRLVLLEI